MMQSVGRRTGVPTTLDLFYIPYTVCHTVYRRRRRRDLNFCY